MSMAFRKATKKEAKARVAISGPAGSGKTYTALLLATAMCKKVAVIDTEHGSASKYADEFDFDVLELDDFHPNNYIQAIKAAQIGGYDGLVIDSISHEWSGKNGCLELSEMYAKKNKGGNKWAGWADVTPLHNAFIEAIHSAKLHIFATMRSKMDYIQAENERGKTEIRKVGMAPITREGVEYEFDIFGEMDLDHSMVITKTRCRALTDRVIKLPGKELAQEIQAWLSDGAPAEKETIERSSRPQSTKEQGATGQGAVSEVEIKRFYSIANKVGANGEIVNLVISKIKPGLIEERDGALHMQWDKVRSGSNLYKQLCELFSSGKWHKVWEQIEAEQAEEAAKESAEEDPLGDLGDIDLENLPF